MINAPRATRSDLFHSLLQHKPHNQMEYNKEPEYSSNTLLSFSP